MSRKLFSFIFVFLALGFFNIAQAENIDPEDIGNDFAMLESDDSQITFDCTHCNAEVTSTQVTGYAWGENTGWINLQPGSSGVVNDGGGNLSGYAWGENTGWVNFDPTYGGVSIVDGFFDGYAWSENYGWILFDCDTPGACVQTSWESVVDSGGGGGSGGGSSPSPFVGCTNPYAINYNPQAVVDNGTCLYDGVVVGCMIPTATNYNPDAVVDDNSCEFNDVETPDNPDDTNDDVVNPNPTDPTPNDPDVDDTDPTDGGENGPGENPGNPIDGGGNTSAGLEDIVNDGITFVPVTETAGVIAGMLFLLSMLTFPLQRMVEVPARLSQLFTSWFGFGKKKTWGVVFDSITKQPLDPVVVALRDESGNVVQTSITDMEGRYGFITKPGVYTLEAHKADYGFPSKILQGKNNDGVYSDIYLGLSFSVSDQNTVITKNIPLDPLKFNWNEYEKARLGLVVTRHGLKKKIHVVANILFWIGFLFSIVAVWVNPTTINFIIIGLYLLVLCIKNFALPKHSGFVLKKDGTPFSFGVMRIYSNALQREIKKVVLDNLGNYYCLIANGEYYVTFEERQADGTYRLVHRTQPMTIRKGAIKNKFII